MPRWSEKKKLDGALGSVPTVTTSKAEEQTVAVRSGLEFLPFTGKESLPNYTEISKGKPEAGIPPKFKYAEPRFFVARGERNTFKVFAVYKSPRNIVRKLWRVIKPLSTRPKDVEMLKKLRAAGIPGAL